MADTNNEATSPAPMALIIKGRPVGVPVPVDAELDPDSDNPVSNAAVCEKFDAINTHLGDIQVVNIAYSTSVTPISANSDYTFNMSAQVAAWLSNHPNYVVAGVAGVEAGNTGLCVEGFNAKTNAFIRVYNSRNVSRDALPSMDVVFRRI